MSQKLLVIAGVFGVAVLAIVAGFHGSSVNAQTATATATATSTPAVPTSTATATPAGTPAACPTGTTLTVAAPTAAAPTTVTVTITPPVNIKAATAGDLTSYHVHYFIDTTATAAGTAVPTGDPKIIHSGSLTQDLGALSAGSHTVTVVLGQVSHVACETRGSVTFTTAAAAATPAAPKTGNAGLTSTDSTMPALALLALAIVVVGGARLATVRAERSED